MSKARYAVATLSLSAAGLVGILNFEGFSETAYIPVAGDIPTIGFGTTEGVKLGDTITPEKAVELAYDDIKEVENCIKVNVKIPINQKIYDSLISFVYNVGCTNFKKSTLLKNLNNDDLIGACSEMKRWVYSGGVRVDGLVKRRQKEYTLCMEGAKDARE